MHQLRLLLVLALLSGRALAQEEPAQREGRAQPEDRARSYLVPAGEVLAEEALLAGLNRTSGMSFAQVSLGSMQANLRSGFAFDNDNFPTNTFLHPYQGALYFTAGRSCGLSFWEAAPYSAAGSLVWELFMETQRPSLNDQVMTSVGGVLFGETLFRLARLTLGPGQPGWGQRLGAFLVDPVGGVNGLAFGERYASSEPAPPPFAARLELGPRLSALGEQRLRPVPLSARLALQLSQGAPDDAPFLRPLDLFDLGVELTGNSHAPSLQDTRGWTWMLLLRGALTGANLQAPGGRGFAGLFGIFDFTGPTWTRTADTGLGPGLVLALRPTPGVRLEGTAVAAAAFGTGGRRVPEVEERDYRYALMARGIADLRLTAGPAELRAALHESLAPLVLDGEPEGLTLLRLSAALHLGGPHALALEGDFTRRRLLHGALERWSSIGVAYVLGFGR